MHPFFAPLDRYELALLLTATTVSASSGPPAGADDSQGLTALFSRLGEPLRGRLTERADALGAMPPETRKSLIASEFKTLLNDGGTSRLDAIDATWLVQALRGEPVRIVGAILLGLQSGAMNSLLKRLPHSVRSQLPPKSELNGIAPRLVTDLRLLFAERFAPMPEPSGSNTRAFDDLLFLERDELYRLIRDLGLTELGQAFAAVEKMALLELCRRLGKAQAHELLQAVQSASKIDRPDAKTAEHFLSKIVVNFDDTEEFLQKSGLWRLARAAFFAEPAWLTAFGQRLPRQAGKVFGDLVIRAQELLTDQDESVRLRLRDAVLLRVVQLSRLGHISQSWQQASLAFHDQAGCQAILDAQSAEMAAQSGQKSAAGTEAQAASHATKPRGTGAP